MRLIAKSGLAVATFMVASFGFASWTQAAPLDGMSQAAPALQTAEQPSVAEALPEKAYHHRYRHHHRYMHHRHYYRHKPKYPPKAY
jgi:hypothetical protein